MSPERTSGAPPAARPAGLAVRAAADRSGSVTTTFAALLPILVASAAVAIDHGVLHHVKSEMQLAADAAALAAAKELSLSDAKREHVPAVVEAIVAQYLAAGPGSPRTASRSDGEITFAKGAAVTESRVLDDPLRVEVKVTQRAPLFFGGLYGRRDAAVESFSAAQVLGKPNICVLGLDPEATGTISLEKNAFVEGRNCAVFSNSTATHGMKATDSSVMKASFICTAGGRQVSKGNFAPDPLTDCPGFDDPLAGRPEPPVGPCLETNLVVDGATRRLEPGTYCGGLHVTGQAKVTLSPGVYVVKDGPLKVDGGSTFAGKGAGFFLTGDKAALVFAGESTLALEAPESGPLAGLLFFEGRQQKTSTKHELLSNNAQTMVGTIYLSRGRLWVGGTAGVGGASAYTAIVARVLELTDGPKIILNTDFGKTDVPVPDGIKGAGQPVALYR